MLLTISLASLLYWIRRLQEHSLGEGIIGVNSNQVNGECAGRQFHHIPGHVQLGRKFDNSAETEGLPGIDSDLRPRNPPWKSCPKR